jgi:ABC-type transport system involved in cytochrome bd biosynthesis fused ATPase/permease subunit
VRHCHGDLHLDNICLLDGRPLLFDCLEFDEELARTDVLYDLAFLLMDLWQRGHRREASLVFNRYCDMTGEAEGIAALPLFLSMRAAVRAHVAAAAASRLDDSEAAGAKRDEARGYLDAACGFLDREEARLVAIGGRSGTGKSTLAALTVRFLDPDSGRVLLADTPLSELAGDAVRSRVALSPQDAHVLAATIVDELRLAAPQAEDAELRAALAAARLEDLVATLPRGWDTPIGENGSRLSGGQRHRLALARTLLVGAPLLVLDEPTADLDAVAGRAFLSDALSSAGERGVLLLTHDLRALPIVDEVVVMEDGRIVARGTHEELLAGDPAYAARMALEFAGR